MANIIKYWRCPTCGFLEPYMYRPRYMPGYKCSGGYKYTRAGNVTMPEHEEVPMEYYERPKEVVTGSFRVEDIHYSQNNTSLILQSDGGQRCEIFMGDIIPKLKGIIIGPMTLVERKKGDAVVWMIQNEPL